MESVETVGFSDDGGDGVFISSLGNRGIPINFCLFLKIIIMFSFVNSEMRRYIKISKVHYYAYTLVWGGEAEKYINRA